MRWNLAGLSGLLAIGGVVLAIAACGSATGEVDPEPGALPAEDETSGTSSSGGNDRPTFDASFAPTDPADANVDPTPDGGGDSCIDNDDAGNTETSAKALAETDDCDNSFKTVKGVISSPVDVDFYKLAGRDKAGCSLDTEFGSGTSGSEICVWARCKNATANAVTGCAQGVEDTSIIGMKGCCATAPSKATPEWDCDGFTDNDSADFIIRIRPTTGAPACLPYSFSYRF